MIKNKTFSIVFLALFLLIELFLGVYIQFASGNLWIALAFSSVVLAFLFSLLFYQKTRLNFLTSTALFFTICADSLLCGVFEIDNYQEIALVFFNVTQICYFLRLFYDSNSRVEKKIHIILRIILPIIAILIAIIVVGDGTNFLLVITMIYFSFLVLNVVFSAVNIKKNLIFFIGLLLFMFCDIFVGLNNIASFISLSKDSIIHKINSANIDFMWLFYVPSQTLIATDLAIKKLKKSI